MSFFTAACAAAFLLVSFCVQAFAQAPNWGAVRVVEQPLSVRHKPDPESPLIRTLKPGDKVRVDFVQLNGWTAVFDMNERERDLTKAIGYVEIRLLGPLVTGKGATPTPAAKPTAAPVPVKTAVAPQEKPAVVKEPAPAAKPAAAPVREVAPPAAVHTPPPQAKAEGHSASSPEIKSEVQKTPSQLSGPAPKVGPQDPVRITSDKMVYSQTENAIVFMGNVHGAQKDMAIWAAKITAYFADKGKQKSQKGGADNAPGDFGDKIERIVAEGSVRLLAGKNEGACAQLTYFVADGILRMEGNPILREGQNTVRGDVIKFYLHENRSEVLSGSQRRVEAIFFSPQGDKK